jgi:heptaprenyl diphosphate synthase
MLEVLLQEIYSGETAQDYVRTWGFWHVLQNGTKEEKRQLQTNEADASKLKNLWHKYKVTAQLYRMLDQQFAQLQSTLSKLGSDKLVQELLSVCEPVKRYLGAPKVIEEI